MADYQANFIRELDVRLPAGLLLPVILLWVLSVSICSAAESPAVMHGGEPRFIIGMYDCPDPDMIDRNGGPRGRDNRNHLPELQSAGFNAYILEVDYSYFGPLTTGYVVSELDLAHSYGLDVIVSMPLMFCNQAEHAVGSAMDNMISAVKNHPALLMYGTIDEPIIWIGQPWCTMEGLQSGTAFVRSRDPQHPIWCNDVGYTGDISQVPSYFYQSQGLCDVYGMDIYPVNAAYPSNNLNLVTKGCDNSIALSSEDIAYRYYIIYGTSILLVATVIYAEHGILQLQYQLRKAEQYEPPQPDSADYYNDHGLYIWCGSR